MGFWETEKQKLALWWETVSKQEIGRFFFGACLLLFLVFLYYFFMGVQDLLHWHRFLRGATECILLIFLTEFMTGKNLSHPFWRVGYIPFALWIGVFPWCLTHAVNGVTDATFRGLNPYFLTAFGILLLLFFLMNVISKVVFGKPFAVAVVLAAVALATACPLAYMVHYTAMGIVMSPREMAFAVNETNLWLTGVIVPRITAVGLLLTVGGYAVFLWLYAKWIWRSAYELDMKWKKPRIQVDSHIHRLLQLVVFLGCLYLLTEWIVECFPLYSLDDVDEYRAYLRIFEMNR